MKIKFKLSVIVIALMVIVIAGLSIIQLRQASGISMDLSLRGLGDLAYQQATYWKGREDSHMRALSTLATTMGHYQDYEPNERRDTFDRILQAFLTHEPTFILAWTTWKSNALDGMDEQYIG